MSEPIIKIFVSKTGGRCDGIFRRKTAIQNRDMIWYTRVLTDTQDLNSQRTQLKASGCDVILREKISGASTEQS